MDFKASQELLELQEKELEMLKVIVKICDENNINYFLMHGSLIGAIRHNGMIPWDDDIDIAIMRKDYKRFYDVCRKDLKEPYFIQYFTTDKGYSGQIIKIRNSQTTAITNSEYEYMSNHKGKDRKLKYNMGVFIDIFVLDSFPENKKVCDVFLKRLEFMHRIVGLYFLSIKDLKTKKGKIKYLISRIFCKIVPLSFIFLYYNNLMQKYNHTSSSIIGYTWWYWEAEKYMWKKEWFDGTKTVQFNGISVKIPIGFDELLKHEYGDYMKPVMSPSDHGTFYKIDMTKSYTNYIL